MAAVEHQLALDDVDFAILCEGLHAAESRAYLHVRSLEGGLSLVWWHGPDTLPCPEAVESRITIKVTGK
ncbi:hypothetical protein GCM10009753_70540 [Streptantibioticus ferralitis]